MMNSIKNIELPKDDSRCASILRTVIRNLKAEGMDSRAASIISANSQTNKVYALRQKMFGNYLPKPSSNNISQSRTASSISISDTVPNVKGPNKVYELRKVMFAFP
jgi:hypothetical protein